MPGDIMDYGALAARLAVNIEDIRACLLMSRDGLTLGVYPREQEAMTREVWDRLQGIGDPERGFLVVRDELWILARRGPYVGVVVASAAATPGLLLDRLEFTLRAAEELRMQDGSATPGSRTEATRRPRTPLHPEPATDPIPRPMEVAAARDVPEPEVTAPMLDLSTPPAAETSSEVEGTPENAPPAPEEDSPADDDLDPVKAAMDFAAMTGAVGVVPTLTPREPSSVDEADEDPDGPTAWGPGSWEIKEPTPFAQPAHANDAPEEHDDEDAEPEQPEEAEIEAPAEPEARAEPDTAEETETAEDLEDEAAQEPFAPPLQPLPEPEPEAEQELDLEPEPEPVPEPEPEPEPDPSPSPSCTRLWLRPSRSRMSSRSRRPDATTRPRSTRSPWLGSSPGSSTTTTRGRDSRSKRAVTRWGTRCERRISDRYWSRKA